jgi:hypothetical protein
MNVRDALEQHGHKSGYAVYREKACCLTGSTLYLAADRRKGSMTTGCQHLAEFFASPHAAQIMAGAATQVTGQDWGFISVGSTVPGPAPKVCECQDERVRLSDGRTLPVTITELALSQAREDAAEDELDAVQTEWGTIVIGEAG